MASPKRKFLNATLLTESNCINSENMQERRPTQKEIAQLTQLTQATVSMALANNSRVSAETRKKVHAAAKKLGYYPDPYLTGLSAYRKQSSSAKYQATLAWLVNDPDNESWNNIPPFYRQYQKGAVRRASEFGYQVEEHQLLSKGMTSKRLADLMWARNIPGILLAPQASPRVSMDIDFTRFATVTFGHSLAAPALHTVASNQMKSMLKLMQQIKHLGYRRPGLALSEQSDQRTTNNWSAAFWGSQKNLPAKSQVPMHLVKKMNERKFITWFKKYRPDVVVAVDPLTREWLISAGERIPETVGVANIAIRDIEDGSSGIWEDPELIGARALEFLVDLIHRHEYGVPKVPLSLMVDGSWMAGATLCQQ